MKKDNLFIKQYDVVIVGGGISGVCAAIASARNGANTALIQNRPVLGGNASSEIRMHICGASCMGKKKNVRETGIIEEILLENKKRNPNHSFSVLDTVLWEKVRFQDSLDLYLNTYMHDVIVKNNIIEKIFAVQQTTEKTFEIGSKIFIDSTGDGMLACLSGAEYMSGREGKDVYGEKHAPENSDHCTMGNSLLFSAVDMGRPIKFEKPDWANTYTEEDLSYRGHTDEISSGYWWIEIGGNKLNIVSDGEEIRDELLRAVYGVWDHIKNSGNHCAENYAIDWVGFLPGKRESRRILGDYVLKEDDAFNTKIFDDAVAYSGWPMDIHTVGGITANCKPNVLIKFDGIFTIPYRSLYSKNIKNLILAGRAISASHIAFSSTRVMGPCSVVGQAAGTAAALAVEKNIDPRDVLYIIKELQQRLLKDDAYIPGIKNEDKNDIARNSKIKCSSSIEGCECANVSNGIARKVKYKTNCWVSKKMNGNKEWISLDFGRIIVPNEIHIRFDSNLTMEIMPTLSRGLQRKQRLGLPFELVRDYKIEFFKQNKVIYTENIHDNYLRFRKHNIREKYECDTIKISVLSTYGDDYARIFEVRVY